MREHWPMPISGSYSPEVAISKTLPPSLPPQFLSRRRLFPLFTLGDPKSTLVIAPAGYGKTTLVAEWASHQEKKVIWLTLSQSDALQEMAAHFIQATRNVIPDFGVWFEKNQPMKASEVVRMWSNELLNTGEEYIFVLDNLREDYEKDVNIANKLLELFPNNIHFVAIRRTPIETLHKVLLSRGNLSMVGASDLKFDQSEIAALADSIGVDLNSSSVQKSLDITQGWPSATSLILHHLHHDEEVNFSNLMKSSTSPLSALAKVALESLSSENQERLLLLSIVEEFTHDLAENILGEKYSFEAITSMGHLGEIISVSDSSSSIYSFSPLMRTILLEKLSDRPEIKRKLHAMLADYYLRRNRHDLAMDHAFSAGKQELVSTLFRDAARIKHAQGKGDELLRWSTYAGNSPIDGVFKKETIEIAGLLSNLNFPGAMAKIEKLHLTALNSEDPEFFMQFAESSAAFIHFNTGDFDSFEKSYRRVFSAEKAARIEVEEQIMLLRLAAEHAFIFDDSVKLSRIQTVALNAGSVTISETAHAYLGAISAMSLFERGEYRKAHEAATIALQHFTRLGIVGLLGPLDLYYVLARCNLEFARREDAYQYFERAATLAKQWNRWPWFVMADGYFARDLALSGHHRQALDRIRSARELTEQNNVHHQIPLLIDLAEIFTRHQMGDLERLDSLVQRGLKIRFVEQMRLMIDEQQGRKSVGDRIKSLPSSNPREAIWKHLANALALKDSEKLSMAEMKQALKIGAEVGARETFLRQGQDLGLLIIKVANESPTVYNEELARAMTIRMQERDMNNREVTQSLTKREREILSLLATGRTLTVIANDLHISQNTMKTHLKNLYKKMGAEGRHDAVEKAKSTFLI